MADKKVTVVVPVYADWSSLEDCIDSLKQYLGGKHKLILVNDCGPEADLLEKNIKEAVKDHKDFYYYRNPRNLGFVKTCNRAVLELDRTDNDILLLNSDTKVTEGFLEEMLAVLYSDSKIGAVSPRTNNATIFTFPLSAIYQKGIDPDESYDLFKKYKAKFPQYNEVPTAHGFCMLIRGSLIEKYGLFDEVFGRGYGEEVDLCQRIAKHGWLSVLSNRSYVFHLEARSFSLEAKAKILKKSNEIIRSRYPTYKQAVTDYIEEALVQEKWIMGKHADNEIPYKLNKSTETLKKIIRRNESVYRLAKAIKRRVRG